MWMRAETLLLPDRRGLEEIRQGGCFVCCKIFRIIQCKSWCGLQWRGRRSSGSLAAIHSACTVRDKTEPDICQLTLQNADYETGEVSLEVTAADYDCPMMYYDYSTDGGRTYTELLPWPGLDIMAGTIPIPSHFP